jgi:hypothetical protein
MVFGWWSIFKIMSNSPVGDIIKKIKKSLIDHCSFILSKNEIEFKLQLHDNK